MLIKQKNLKKGIQIVSTDMLKWGLLQTTKLQNTDF